MEMRQNESACVMLDMVFQQGRIPSVIRSSPSSALSGRMPRVARLQPEPVGEVAHETPGALAGFLRVVFPSARVLYRWI